MRPKRLPITSRIRSIPGDTDNRIPTEFSVASSVFKVGLLLGDNKQ